MVLISFEHLQKIHNFGKFGRCSSKIRPTTPISISCYQRAWQTFSMIHTLQTFKNDSFFIDEQMILLSFFFLIIPAKNPKFKKNLNSFSALLHQLSDLVPGGDISLSAQCTKGLDEFIGKSSIRLKLYQMNIWNPSRKDKKSFLQNIN